MQIRLKHIAALGILVALWGCQTVPAPKEPAPPPKEVVAPAPPERSIDEREREQVSLLVAYFHGVANLGPEEQRRELAAATQASARDRGLYSRLRLALLLTVPGTSFADDARAVSLLDPALPVGAPAGTSAPAASAGPSGPLRQFAGMLYSLVGERLREQRRAVQLKEQLDALRAVERSLIERSQGRRP